MPAAPLTRPLILRLTGPATPHPRQFALRVPQSISSVQRFTTTSSSSSSLSPQPRPRPLIRPTRFVSSYLPQHHTFRAMSSAPAKKEFLCILPDTPGAQAKRVAVRPSHLEGVKPLVGSGSVVAGGAMLNHHPAEGETPSYKGSMMLVMGENEAEVRELLAKDIYATSGVWDLENAQIIPFKSAVRQQL